MGTVPWFRCERKNIYIYIYHSLEVLKSIAKKFSLFNGLTFSKILCNLHEQLSSGLWQYNAKLILYKLALFSYDGDSLTSYGSVALMGHICFSQYIILLSLSINFIYNQQGIALRRRRNTESNCKILKPKSYTLISTKDRKMQSKTIKE